MRSSFLKNVVFISKSLLWSALLYVACIVVTNWDYIGKTPKHNNPSFAIQNVQTQPVAQQQPTTTPVTPNNQPQSGGQSFFSGTAKVLTGLYKIVTIY